MWLIPAICANTKSMAFVHFIYLPGFISYSFYRRGKKETFFFRFSEKSSFKMEQSNWIKQTWIRRKGQRNCVDHSTDHGIGEPTGGAGTFWSIFSSNNRTALKVNPRHSAGDERDWRWPRCCNALYTIRMSRLARSLAIFFIRLRYVFFLWGSPNASRLRVTENVQKKVYSFSPVWYYIM